MTFECIMTFFVMFVIITGSAFLAWSSTKAKPGSTSDYFWPAVLLNILVFFAATIVSLPFVWMLKKLEGLF